MKKIFSLLLIGVVALMALSCSDDDDDIVTSPDTLPATAQTFLKTYFDGDAATLATRDSEDGSWDVTLNSGVKVEFDAAGNWTEVEGTLAAPIPNQDFIPVIIREYVAENYPFEINEISRDAKGYEVQLTDLLKLQFDPQGNFVTRLN